MESQYQKISILGEGNFGMAILCRKADELLVVLKKISHGEDKQRYEDALREARILSVLKNPHVIRANNTFRSASSVYIEMEYLEGGTLAAFMDDHIRKTNGPMADLKIFSYIRQLAIALDYIHTIHSIVHRDVKPANVLMSADAATLKLADFGIAIIVRAGETVNGRIGTSSYMAPEVLNAQDYSFPVDVWALGCVAFELVERRRCFDASNEIATQYKIVSGTIPLSENTIFRPIIERMLTRYSAHRATARDVLDALEKKLIIHFNGS